jgi:hypothetical protein
MGMSCGRCGSTNLNVNGLFYTCKNCGFIDDSTFEMIMQDAELTEEGKVYVKNKEKKASKNE